LMDGSISVESEYGKGSVFTVRFKQKFVNCAVIGETVVNNLKSFRYSDAKRKQSSQLARVKMPYARVLVVDDNVTNLDVAKGLMRPYEMHIDCVTGGQQAINAVLAEDGKYNAIFMDHMMPGMDGIEATRRIRAIGTDYAKNIPIIALTANAIAGNEEKFLNNGFQDFLSKPIDLLRLDEVLRRRIRDKSKEIAKPGEPSGITEPAACDLKLPIREYSINGMDIAKGLERFGGDEEIYLSILRSYAVNTPPLLDLIKNAGEDGLTAYAINVHGIKGSSRGISADKAGDLAESLEMAAKAGDFDFVIKNNAELLTVTEKLIADINDMLSKYM